MTRLLHFTNNILLERLLFLYSVVSLEKISNSFLFIQCFCSSYNLENLVCNRGLTGFVIG